MLTNAITDRLELESEERAALGLTSSQIGGGSFDVSGEDQVKPCGIAPFSAL